MPAAPCESPFDGRVVFVLGSRRSGTTWLAELLLAHPDIAGLEAHEVVPGAFIPLESAIFGALADVWKNNWRFDGEGLCSAMSRSEIAVAMRRFCDRLFAGARDRVGPGRPWFLEKSPDNAVRLPIMATVFPDAWYVQIVRDGRDMARSLARVGFGPDDPAEAAAEWVRDTTLVREHNWLLERFREVRYENLLADPTGHVAELYRWMGLPVDDEVMTAVEERASRAVATYGMGTPVGSGKWRELDPPDLDRLTAVAGDLLAELGYLDEGAP